MRRRASMKHQGLAKLSRLKPAGVPRYVSWLLATALMLAVFAPPISAGTTNYAETMAASQIGYSARLLGMAGVQVGLADEPSTLFSNPAGLAVLSGGYLTTLYTRPFGASDHFAATLGKQSLAVGGSLTTTSVDRTNEYGQPTGGTAGYQEASLAIGWGAPLWRANGGTLYGGAAARYLRQVVAETSGSGVTVDAGLLVQAGSAQLGLSRHNLAFGGLGVVRYSDGVEDPLDPSTTLSLGLNFGPVLVAADYTLEDRMTRVGAEAALGRLALRAGVAASGDGDRMLSLGTGMAFGPIRVDYAYQAHSALPDSHRLSLAVKL